MEFSSLGRNIDLGSAIKIIEKRIKLEIMEI